jgi:hypothetical protein
MAWQASLTSDRPLTIRRSPLGVRLLVLMCALFAASTAHAQLYKWVDENGRTQYGDTIPPTSTDRARKELRADGTVRQSTDRAPTAEEKRAAALKAAEDATRKIEQDERDRKDKALLMTYSSLADFDRVRDRALAVLNADVRALTIRESLLSKTIAANGVAPTTPGAPNPASGAVKAPTIALLEAKSELPRVTDSLARKSKELESATAVYSAERNRLARLIDAENARIQAMNPTPIGTSASAEKKR